MLGLRSFARLLRKKVRLPTRDKDLFEDVPDVKAEQGGESASQQETATTKAETATTKAETATTKAETATTKAETEKQKVEDQPATAEWLAKRHHPPIFLPPALLKATASVLAKHSHKAVREYGDKLAKAYSLINSTEKPRNIEHVQPFATSTEALQETVEKHQKTFFDPFLKDFMKLEAHSLTKPRNVEDDKQLLMTIKYETPHALGYLYKRQPRSYASAYRVLSEVQVRMPVFKPKKVLDYGAGLGAGMWAANSLYPDLKVIAGVEPADVMKSMGKKLSVAVGKMRWFDNIAALPTSASEEGRFDIVMLNYVLGEVESSKLRALIVEALWHRTTGLLVVIESGAPKGFRLIHSVRDWALKNFTREECNIVAPCPHEGNCPLAKDKSSWCHFSAFSSVYPKDVIGQRVGLPNYENEKFSYIVLKKGLTPRQQFTTKAETKSLDQTSYFWDRLVRPVLRPTRFSILDVCPHSLNVLPLNKTGDLQRVRVSKKKHKEAHKFARKAHWGDLWPFNTS